MSLTKTSNLRHAELVERMAQFVDLEAPLYGFFRGVLSKYNDNWSLLMGAITFCEEGEHNELEVEACHQRYPAFQFIARPLGWIKLSDLMLGLSKEGQLPIPDLRDVALKLENTNWTESLIPSHVNKGTFPQRCFASQVCSDVFFNDSKLIAHGLPFHLSAFEYVEQFLGMGKFHGTSDGRKGELSIKLPDRRGHLTLSDREVYFSSGNVDTLSLVGAVDGKPVQLRSPQGRFAFESERASDVELWLVADNNEIIDYRSSSEWEYCLDTQTDSGADLAKMLQIIASGEGEHCELKPYIDLFDKKAWEIDRTVCAFSNHQGGKLFIGVDDDLQITGINEGCQREYKRDPQQAVELYQKAVNKRLQESLIKNQCFNTYLIKQHEQFVLVVEVHKANGLNYLLKKTEAYIRRGASSPKMTPVEIQAFTTKTDALGRKLWFEE